MVDETMGDSEFLTTPSVFFERLKEGYKGQKGYGAENVVITKINDKEGETLKSEEIGTLLEKLDGSKNYLIKFEVNGRCAVLYPGERGGKKEIGLKIFSSHISLYEDWCNELNLYNKP